MFHPGFDLTSHDNLKEQICTCTYILTKRQTSIFHKITIYGKMSFGSDFVTFKFLLCISVFRRNSNTTSLCYVSCKTYPSGHVVHSSKCVFAFVGAFFSFSFNNSLSTQPICHSSIMTHLTQPFKNQNKNFFSRFVHLHFEGLQSFKR